jgi:hypothetical protein
MQCRPVVATLTFVKYKQQSGYDCVVDSYGIKMLCSSSELRLDAKEVDTTS